MPSSDAVLWGEKVTSRENGEVQRDGPGPSREEEDSAMSFDFPIPLALALIWICRVFLNMEAPDPPESLAIGSSDL